MIKINNVVIENKNIIYILEKLNANGFEAYLVGGCIRDLLLSKKPNDYDIATNALSSDIKEIFCDYKLYLLGEKFGTVGICVDDEIVEITTFRVDEAYSNHRKPDVINFNKNINEDLSRRDFTINALAYDPINKKFIDNYNGVSDLNNKIIRCVRIPCERFEEDGLRIIRAMRFASQLGFIIEDETDKAIKLCYKYSLDIPFERIAIEITKLINGKMCKDVLLKYRDILMLYLKVFEFDDYYKFLDCDLLEHKLLFMYYNHQDIIDDDLMRLMIKKSKINYYKGVYEIIKNVDFNNEICIKMNISDNNINMFNDALLIKKGTSDMSKEEYCVYYSNIINAFSSCHSLKQLAINGNDIKKFISKKKMKYVLNDVLEMVIKEELVNEKDILLDYVLRKNHHI